MTGETHYSEKMKYLEKNVQTHIHSILSDIINKKPENILLHIIKYCENASNQNAISSKNKKSYFDDDDKTPDLNPKTPEFNHKTSQFNPEVVQEFSEMSKKVIAVTQKLEKEVSQKSSFTHDSNEDVSDSEFEKKIQNMRGHKQSSRNGISAESSNRIAKTSYLKTKRTTKSKDETEIIIGLFNKSFLFSQLDKTEKQVLVETTQLQTFPKGKMLIKQGDVGQEVFIVASGFLKCFKADDSTKKEMFLINYIKGDVFGELSLLYNCPRAASIIAETDCSVYSIERETFNQIVRSSIFKRHGLYEELIKQVDFLKGLTNHQRNKLCECFKMEEFVWKDFVIKEGEEAHKIYFILEGTAEALKKNENGVVQKVFKFVQNDYFGELALINDDKRQASIRITSKTAKLASLDKETFTRLLGDVVGILTKKSQKYEKAANKKKLN